MTLHHKRWHRKLLELDEANREHLEVIFAIRHYELSMKKVSRQAGALVQAAKKVEDFADREGTPLDVERSFLRKTIDLMELLDDLREEERAVEKLIHSFLGVTFDCAPEHPATEVFQKLLD
jgi:hypothetical protein